MDRVDNGYPRRLAIDLPVTSRHPTTLKTDGVACHGSYQGAVELDRSAADRLLLDL